MLFFIFAILLWCCADPVDRDIADLIEGGDVAAEARIALNMAKGTAIEPLIAAFIEQAHPVRARAERHARDAPARRGRAACARGAEEGPATL